MSKIKLRVKWSKKEDDFVVYYPRKSDGGWILCHLFDSRYTILPQSTGGKDSDLKEYCKVDYNPYMRVYETKKFAEELVQRGFDKTTLKFEVTIDLNQIQERFPHIWEMLSEKEKNKILKNLKK